MCNEFSALLGKRLVEFTTKDCNLTIANKIEVSIDEIKVPFEKLTFSNGSRSKIEKTIRKKIKPVKPTEGAKNKRDGQKIRHTVLC